MVVFLSLEVRMVLSFVWIALFINDELQFFGKDVLSAVHMAVYVAVLVSLLLLLLLMFF